MNSAILTGDAVTMLRTLPAQSVQCCVTSPPYWGLRDYGTPGQIGLESSPSAYLAALMPVFEEVRRGLRNDGTLWLNLGDTYIGYHGNGNAQGEAPSDKPGYRENMRQTTVGADNLKNKDLAGIPWRVAFALQDAGWYLRADIIWQKPNSAPESVKDRPTREHEYIFLLSKSSRYTYDAEAVREPVPAIIRKWQRPNHRLPDSRNRRSVWTVSTRPYADAHFATFPPDLIRPCILAGCPQGGTVLDPFFGSGTVGQVCVEEGRRFIGIEINPDYVAMAERRVAEAHPKGPSQRALWDAVEVVA